LNFLRLGLLRPRIPDSIRKILKPFSRNSGMQARRFARVFDMAVMRALSEFSGGGVRV